MSIDELKKKCEYIRSYEACLACRILPFMQCPVGFTVKNLLSIEEEEVKK